MKLSILKSSQLLRSAAAIATLWACTVSAHMIDTPDSEKPKHITVYVAKKIVTMDPSNPSGTAVAIADGKILSVGSLADLKPWLDRYPHKIDRQFENKILYPGFVDPHNHPFIGGITQTSNPITYFSLPNPWGKPTDSIKTLQAAISKLKQYSTSISDPNETLLSWGFDIVGLKQIPDAKLLDQVSQTRPIIVWDSSEHNVFLNTAAIKKYITDIDAAKKLIGVGVNPDGTLNGRFMGIAANQYAMKQAARDIFNLAKVNRAMLYSNDQAQQGGITTTTEMTFGILDIDFEKKLMEKFTNSNVTSLRISPRAYANSFVEKYGDQAIQQVRDLKKLDTDRLFYKGVKFFIDDAYLSNTMRVENPGYTDWHQGIIFYPSAEVFAKAMQPWWNAGIQIHVHSNGSEGNERVLNALQFLQDEKPRFDHRFAVEHFGMPSSMMIRKLKVLGGVASVNPAYFYERAGLQAEDLGYDRISYATRVGDLVRNGVPTAIHSDNPVAVPRPLTEVWAVVNRQNLYTGNKKWAPSEAVTVQQALRMVTIDAAYVIGMEDKVGSIEPGKYADFVVLKDDPQTVRKEKIKDIPVLGTVLGGRYVPVSETSRERPY